MNLRQIFALAASILFLPLAAHAQDDVEATIRKNLAQRVPVIKSIDEVRPTRMEGIYEVRSGEHLFYTDSNANFMLHPPLLDTRERRNLTEERMEKINGIDFDVLPIKDAVKIVYGDGSRKVAIFEDPNCGYCKQIEKDLAAMDNVTVYAFIVPILGKNSVEKAKRVWCAADKAEVWSRWMQHNSSPPETESCDTAALDNNVAFAKAHGIVSTPNVIFADGSRLKGYAEKPEIERRLTRQ